MATAKKPTTRKTNAKTLVLALDGKERPYPVYDFRGRPFAERPGHNPFAEYAPP